MASRLDRALGVEAAKTERPKFHLAAMFNLPAHLPEAVCKRWASSIRVSLSRRKSRKELLRVDQTESVAVSAI